MGINSPIGLLISLQLIESKGQEIFSGKIVGQKTSILQKRTGEVIENKGSELQNGIKRTGKRTGEVL
ncbi:MAG TPA: hypothetical protein VFC10_17195 [Terriglobia bacterium]|nr:hypothetical protein [Terriglobia bacterium]